MGTGIKTEKSSHHRHEHTMEQCSRKTFTDSFLFFVVVVVVFFFFFLILRSRSVTKTEGARLLVGGERRGQIWRKSAIKVTESECCELVLNAVLRKPVKLFQKRSNYDRASTFFFSFSRRAARRYS